VLTATTLGLTVLFTATRLIGNGPLDALRRDPAALGHGQLWRLLSPVLVQSDASLVSIVGVFVLCAVIGAFAEQRLTRRRWLALYLVGALTGHAIGEAFQPLQGGTSVAFAGILGGLGAYALLGRDPALRRWRWHAVAAIPLSILDTALGDIHGVPYLAGLALGLLWIIRDGGASSGNDARNSANGAAYGLEIRAANDGADDPGARHRSPVATVV
jgi:membrane associated rhomboid family serine protease